MKSNNIYEAKFASRFFPGLIIAAIGLLLLTFYQIVPSSATAGQKRGWFAFWTLAPAMWFAIEHHWIYPKFKNPDADLSDFKQSQGIAEKFWAAVVVLVGALATGKI